MKVTKALKDKAIAELSKELKKHDERLCNERKEVLCAPFVVEESLRRIHSAHREEEVVPFDAIIGPLECDIKKYKYEIAVLRDDKKVLERHLKINEAAFVEAGDILRNALKRVLIIEDVQNRDIELKKQKITQD
ncbi:microtubule-associated protein 70-4-like [Hordeum vulgare]|nr:microtubule-associated protein 70-4-like [Hordeum vulgare]